MTAKRFGQSGVAANLGAVLIVALTAGSSLAGPGDDCPPNPEPGKCYEKVYRPAQYETYVDQAAPAGRPGEAADRVVTRQRKIREASFAWQVIPCQAAPDSRRGR